MNWIRPRRATLKSKNKEKIVNPLVSPGRSIYILQFTPVSWIDEEQGKRPGSGRLRGWWVERNGNEFYPPLDIVSGQARRERESKANWLFQAGALHRFDSTSSEDDRTRFTHSTHSRPWNRHTSLSLYRIAVRMTHSARIDSWNRTQSPIGCPSLWLSLSGRVIHSFDWMGFAGQVCDTAGIDS